MKLENQVCTLKQAKRLRELGIAKESLFCYVSENLGNFEVVATFGYSWSDFPDYSSYKHKYFAYTVAELGVMLPDFQHQNGKGFWISFPSHSSDIMKWIGAVETPNRDHSETIRHRIVHDTEAQARAAMLIYLIENNHITPDEVNKRLLNA